MGQVHDPDGQPVPQAAEGAEIVVTMVSDTPDVEEVVMGANGIIHGAPDGAILIDMSTISPEATRQMARQLNEKGVVLMDAPISGGQIGAIEAKLSIMAGVGRRTSP